MTAEQEPKKGPEPQRIISDKTSFDIISTGIKKRLFVDLIPDGKVWRVNARIENLTMSEEERNRLETHFTETIGDYFVAAINSRIASQIDTSDAESPRMVLREIDMDLGKAINSLHREGYSEEKIRELIKSKAILASGGEKRMGIMPTNVGEILTELNTRVEDFYKNAKEEKKKKSNKA